MAIFTEIYSFRLNVVWPLQKKLQVYFKYTSFILQILEVQQRYALSELPKKKYK